MLAVCLAALLCAGAVQAQDKKPADKPLERKTLDESVYQNLRGIIDHGANLYNQGDWNGCYRLWEGALMTLKPLLDHRPKLQEAIEKGITDARQDPALWHRAWVLRPVLDKIRADINADYPHKKKREAGAPAVAEQKPKTLWDRLGGDPGVTKIVDDFVNLAAPNPKVDFFRGGKFTPTAAEVAKMKRELIEQISEASGGPLKYKGPDMKKVHKGMGITDAQFNAAGEDLKKALEKNNVVPEDVEKVLNALGSYRKEIVEPKKKDEKKQEEKKPAGAASVEGHISFQGKPLSGGTVVLASAQGNAAGDITVTGTYRVEGVKPGEYSVSIMAAKADGVPAKFGDPKTSGLKISVQDGKNTFDIELR
jgi:hemoglobin